ncbi:MAG: MerR family transcriptional regulator [Bacteroidetes bacterium]|nr:MerR family transcriptional regulator [Bacteroidota bacterium]
MIQYSIKDLEKLTGIKAHTIRIWEKRYDIVNPHRTSTNIRFYTDMDLKKLMNVASLVRFGLKISSLSGLSYEELNEKIVEMYHRPNVSNSQIDQLIVAMSDLDDKKFNIILSNATLDKGFENTIIEVIFPFMERLGLLWQTGNINTAHERFVMNILRQKLIVAIDGLYYQPNKNSKLFVMFLPKDEYHEIELLFFRYIIRKAGHKIVYLGQSIPFFDLKEIINIKNPDYLFTCVNSPQSDTELKLYLSKLANLFPHQTIFVAGKQINACNEVLPDNVKKIISASDIKSFLENSSK